jgi:hypothetical protein
MILEGFSLVPIVAAIAGGVTGYVIARPRPSVLADRILLSTSRYASTSPVEVNRHLALALAAYPNGISKAQGWVIPERTYVVYLELVRAELNSYITDGLAALEHAKQLRALAIQGDYKGLRSLYASVQAPLLSRMSGGYRRAEWSFSNPATDATGVEPKIEYGTNAAGDFVLYIGGTQTIVFAWSDYEKLASGPKVKELMTRLSSAFVYELRDDLVEVFDALPQILDVELAQGRDLLAQVDEQLAKYNRIIIGCVVANTGRSPLSIATDASAVVSLGGYTYTDGKGGARTVPEDLVVHLRLISASAIESMELAALTAAIVDLNRDSDEPILVQPGEAVRITGTSEVPLAAMPEKEAILAAYMGAERTAQLRMGRYANPRRVGRAKGSPTRDLHSKRVLFRDIRFRSGHSGN